MKARISAGILIPCAVLFLGCLTSQAHFVKIAGMHVPDALQSRKIVNLAACEFLNAQEKIYGDKLMKSGFLDTGTEEYGYYFINTEWKTEPDYALITLSAFTLGVLQPFGVPYEIDTYNVTATIDIFDANGNLIRDFAGSGTFRQAVGYYYGRDNSERVHEEFLRIVAGMQRSINDQSDYINGRLRESGPIGAGYNEEAAKNMLVYLSSRYNRVLASTAVMKPEDTVQNPAADSFYALSAGIPGSSVITLVNINAENQAEGARILNELTVQFVNSGKYVVVDRTDVEKIEREQNFQLSGFVSDDSIVSIGQFLGADVVITGSISGTAGNRRLTLKALDVQTARILAASSVKM